MRVNEWINDRVRATGGNNQQVLEGFAHPRALLARHTKLRTPSNTFMVLVLVLLFGSGSREEITSRWGR